MAITLLSDIIVPEVFNAYMAQNSTEKTRLVRSGIAQAVPGVTVPDGGETVNMPFWNDLDGTPQAIQSGTEITASKLTSGKDVARVLTFANGWGAEDLAAETAGSDPMIRIADRVT